MAYSRDSFVGGSSVLSISMYEMDVWDYYHTHVKTEKIDRIETPLAYSALSSCVNKLRGIKKMKDVLCMPIVPKKSAMDLFSRGKFLKKKVK